MTIASRRISSWAGWHPSLCPTPLIFRNFRQCPHQNLNDQLKETIFRAIHRNQESSNWLLHYSPVDSLLTKSAEFFGPRMPSWLTFSSSCYSAQKTSKCRSKSLIATLRIRYLLDWLTSTFMFAYIQSFLTPNTTTYFVHPVIPFITHLPIVYCNLTTSRSNQFLQVINTHCCFAMIIRLQTCYSCWQTRWWRTL